MKISLKDAGHMTKMAADPIKSLQKSGYLRNQLNDFQETWFVASKTLAHHSLLK